MIFSFVYRVYARINWFFYRVSTFKKNLWKLLFPECTYERFFWDRMEQSNNTTLSHVPEYTVHVEQWYRNDGELRRYVTYATNPIEFYQGDPFGRVKTPWLWIGDPNDDDVDVTSEMNKYIVPGNLILPELVTRATGLEEVYYMDPRSLEILKFPEQGIVLEHDAL